MSALYFLQLFTMASVNYKFEFFPCYNQDCKYYFKFGIINSGKLLTKIFFRNFTKLIHVFRIIPVK